MGGGPDEIDIDPELIAAATAAVESRVRKKRKFAPSRRQEETGDPVTVDLEQEAGLSEEAANVALADGPTAVTPVAPVRLPSVASILPPPRPAAQVDEAAEEQRLLLTLRLRDTTERLRRVEDELARMTEARDGLDRQCRELREAAHRASADSELARIRARKEREELERTAEERVLRGLLDIVENVERGLTHGSQDPARVQAGLNMIAEQFKALLKRLGVERIVADPGTLFDPAQHEALLHVATNDVLPGCVVNEVAAGFMLRGRMMRPARVVVASTPADS
ncbi:hypothetical protein LBMAG42_38280 [Deltaproteobacteria bacterium]|nr:hypothetical protein LBMAG42_38280 [Deltaproteobacteria bacterium]